MGFRKLAVGLAFGLVLAGCGGDEAASPLTLQQRVPSAADAPGTEPDPVEQRVTMTGVDELKTDQNLLHEIETATDEDARAIAEAGFVSAIVDTRFFPSEPGGEHESGVPHVFTRVLQFDSEDAAREAADLMQQIRLRPCPETCAFVIGEFDVDDGPPDAKGAQRIATQASLERVGDAGDRPPRAEYAIDFADGPFVYDIVLAGPPEEVSEPELEAIVKKLYDRVAGAPAAASG